jgi:hypothetical protein
MHGHIVLHASRYVILRVCIPTSIPTFASLSAAMSSKPENSSPHKLARPDSDCNMASLSSVPKHILALTPADLDVENPALVEFVQFARHVIDQNDPLKAAKYAGMLYLALISAFEADGMIEYEWAPTLTLEIQSIEYEVSLRDGKC